LKEHLSKQNFFHIFTVVIQVQHFFELKKQAKKRIIVSVTNDLVADNRVHKVCTSLVKMGFDVLLVGRKLPQSLPVSGRNYSTKRFRLLFKKGPLFYACFNFRLFLFLLFAKFDVALSNDLDTLTANFLASGFRNKPLVYDSHEYFTEVPELVNRPRVQKTWEWLEKRMLPKLKNAYTVCDSIATAYREKYGTPFRVVRNVPFAKSSKFNLAKTETKEKIVLYQGAVNVHRGLEQAIRAMKYLDDTRLVIAGDGDITPQLKKLVQHEKLEDKVEFLGRLPIEKLAEITFTADLGLSIEEDVGLNYRFALPNKLFDYIQAGVPALVTNLPEMAAIVKEYEIGEITDSLEPENLAEKIKTALIDESKRTVWNENLKKAANELTWENEEKQLAEIFRPFL
jgi:glycosyltransferase involved in cell wall biosynthesis